MIVGITNDERYMLHDLRVKKHWSSERIRKVFWNSLIHSEQLNGAAWCIVPRREIGAASDKNCFVSATQCMSLDGI